MKKILFVHTHIGSGYQTVLKELDKIPRFQSFQGLAPFQTFDDLTALTKKHKLNNASAVYVHPLVKNEEWVVNSIRNSAKNIFLIANPDISFSEIYGRYDDGLSYYAFRLKGLYEVAKQTDDKLIVTADDLSAINQYLNVELPAISLTPDSLPEELHNAGVIKYAKYLDMLRDLA